MGKKFLSILLGLALLSPISISAKELNPIKNISKIQNIQKLKNLSNGKIKLNQKDGQVFLSGKLSDKQIPGEKSAVKFLEENKHLLEIDSITSDLKTVEVKKDHTGDTYVKFIQMIKGIKVQDSLINVHFDKNGVIVSVNGKLEKDKSITPLGNKRINESKAIEIAKKQYTYKSLRNNPKAEKIILNKDKKNYEVYKVNISYMEPSISNYDVYVEVSSGKVIKTENNIRYDGAVTGSGIDVQGKSRTLNLYKSGTQYQMKDVTKSATSNILTFSLNHGYETGYLVSNSTNVFNSEDFKASVSAHYYAGKVIDFYKKLFNRNSLDNNGMIIKSFTHYGNNYNNAFWTGYEMVYGDGDGSKFTYLSGDLDVVGHEMTHGVINNTANLYYHNQSGALNESMADVFGVLISTYEKYNVASGQSWSFNTADWVVGDDIYTPNIPGDALRSLANPALYGQPDNMSKYEYLPDTEGGDWGGVHINSGIPNKAAYLVAKSIGMEKTAKIYYRALVNYMSAYTDFEYAKLYLKQAATDLYGGNSAEVTAVNNAFNSVGIGQPAVQDPYEPNDTFDTSYPINFGTTYQSYISTPVDWDFYSLNVNSTGNINIALSNLPNDNDLYLYDPSGDRVAESENWNTTAESIDFNVSETGKYYILVYPYTGYSTTQKYSLKITGATATLPIPASVKAVSASYNSIKVSWAAVTGASGYEVYRATSSTGTYSKISATTSTSYTNTSLATGTTYYYKVRAYRTAGTTNVYSGYSTAVSAKPIPSTPTSVKAVSASYNSINVSWAAVNGASGYEVYRATSSTGTYSKVSTTTSTSYTNTGLTTNSTYYYKVRAYRTVGTTKVYSSYPTAVSAKPIPSTPASVKAVSASYNSIKVSWAAVTGASGYEVYRAASSTGTYSKISTTTSTSYTNTSLATGTTYYYKVRAYRTVGTTKVYSGYSTAVSAKPIPSTPTSVKAVSASYNSIKVSWTAVTGASGYEVYRATSSTGTYTKVSTTTSTSYTNTGLTTNSTYYYKVRAYKTVGTSKVYSNYSSVVNAKPIPSTPTNFKAARASSTSIKLTWSGVSGASGYEIYRATSSTGTYSYLTRTTNLYYTNSGLTTGKTYYYKARSYRTVGTTKVYSGWTAVVYAKP